jgi:hypothetical protein
MCRDDFGDVLETGICPRPAKPGPAALLVARYQVVPFFEPGRAKLIAELRAWAEDVTPARARLLHGAGGMGKTRLFIHWCGQLRNEGWRAGFLRKEASREPNGARASCACAYTARMHLPPAITSASHAHARRREGTITTDEDDEDDGRG